MTLPEVEVLSRETPPASSSEVQSGTWFVGGLAERGPSDSAVAIRNMEQKNTYLGDREGNTLLHDALDTYFREGGALAIVSRIFGPNPTTATVTIDDASAADSIKVDALSPGAWGADLDVVIAGAGPFTLTVEEDDVAVEVSPALADNAELVAWSANSSYIRVTDLGGDIPDEGEYALVGGTDDRANVTDATREAALDRFTKDLGPGQVSFPGIVTATAQAQLLEHAENNNRVAVVDHTDTATEATLIGEALALRTSGRARYGAGFAPWAVVPGITPNTTRTVPYSAVECGIIARNHSLGLGPNKAAAGLRGRARYAIGLSQVPWTDAERETLHDAGVNVARVMDGGVRTYGYRTYANPLTADKNWLQFNWARTDMEIRAKARQKGEAFQFEEIDGQGKTISDFNGVLAGMLLNDYHIPGSLYGRTPAEAFKVDTGPQVNTEETIAEGKLKAVLSVKISPHAERTEIEVVKLATGEVI